MKSNTYIYQSNMLFMILLVITLASGDSSVRIYSKLHQPVTSSTLNWLPIAHRDDSKEIVIGGFQKTIKDGMNSKDSDSSVENEEQPVFVCRVLYGGVWVAGSQIKGKKQCTVTLLGSTSTHDQYYLLENVENSARLRWLAWDKFHKIPVGTVLVSDGADGKFIARHVVSNKQEDNNETDSTYTHYIGTLDTTIGLGKINYVKNNGEEGSAVVGEILVESEPIFYDLTSVKLNYWRKRTLKNESQILGTITISNNRDEPAKLAQAFSYDYEYLSYWGQGHAMIKALNTSITLVNGTRLPNIEWGLREQGNRTDLYTVEIYLEARTAVNVTLRANYVDMEVPYMGKLVSHYEDRETRSREISGIRREQTMMNVRPEFSPIYFINNQSIVPTTLSPPTSHMTTITVTQKKISTSSVSVVSSSSTSHSDSISKTTLSGTTSDIVKDDFDENSIIPPRKTDNSMQNDDRGPLSLKNKEESASDFSNIAELSIVVFLTSIFASIFRIT
ncbi:protein unzipped isoform X2 [Chelonus insularis]|nr:protein unzipped isoform X2 [Chelonus insularis]XP_034950914.1 protein unzipped isoform X2 [Chelonus insularis]XP_034950915.1 protein unzipped isoform X2 [Chelonus insularis]